MSRFQFIYNQEDTIKKRNFDHMHMANKVYELCTSSDSTTLLNILGREGLEFENTLCGLPNSVSLVKVESHEERRTRNKQARLVDETCIYLKSRLHEKHQLDDIAYSMGTNRSKLAASFKAVTGMGVFEWLRERRMVKAKALLLATELSIQQVAFEVGFENCANFSTAFKKQYLISPRQQRSINVLA